MEVLESLGGLSGLANISASGLVVLFVLMLYSGRIVPKTQVDDIRTDYKTHAEKQAELVDTWRETAADYKQRGDSLEATLDRLLQTLDTVQRTVAAERGAKDVRS